MIFIDTGAFLGRYIQNDQHHPAAAALWEKLASKKIKIFSSNFVLDETFTLLARWAGYSFAAARAKNIYSSEKLTILRPEHSDEMEAIDLFEKYADQKISYTDCISFVLMRRERIKTAFSFDKHFHQLGFELMR